MPRTLAELRADCLAIWQAAVEGVRSDRLVRDNVRVDEGWLIVGDEALRLADIGRIAVVGAGKAGAGMAVGLAEALGPELLAEKRVQGWINVPADCVALGAGRLPASIHLHAARPPGINEPTAEGVLGAERILSIVESLGPADVCFCLISGGGSALLPAPAGVTLAEKQALTQLLSSGGANIHELNTVRKQLSRIKGGGLALACRAGRLIALVISDVLGDPLEVIASGPTVADSSTPQVALAILERFAPPGEPTAAAAMRYLRARASQQAAAPPITCRVANLVIGNNAVAVDAAGVEAERRGYSHAMHAATRLEGPAEEVGRHLAQMARRMLTQPGPDCLITGGEPTVTLAPAAIRGKGGRNQQLVLAALIELMQVAAGTDSAAWKFALLSGGTDGEDGPTDAAGAIIDGTTLAHVRAAGLDPADHLRRNDAYHFFAPLGGLLQTGPTHTNVCDVRVVVVERGL